MIRIAICLIVAVTVALLAAAPADAGVSVHYSSGHWNLSGHFGYPYSYYPYSYSPYYSYPYRYYVQYYPQLPVYSLGNGLPYIPPGTIFTMERPHRYYSYYSYPYSYYGYPYSSYGLGGFAGAYLASAPQVGSERAPAPQSSSPQVINNITVQVVPSTATSEPRVTIQHNASWKRGLWTVPVAESQPAATTVPPAATTQPPATVAPQAPVAPPVQADTEASYLYTLTRGDDAQRLKAATELKRFNTPAVVSALVDAMARDGLVTVRKEAARSLGTMLARKAHDALWKAAREDADASVRAEARDAALKIEAYTN